MNGGDRTPESWTSWPASPDAACSNRRTSSRPKSVPPAIFNTPLTDFSKQPRDKTGGTASVAGITVVQERAVLQQQRRKQAASHASVDEPIFNPWADTTQLPGPLNMSIPQFMLLFKRGQREKTRVGVHLGPSPCARPADAGPEHAGTQPMAASSAVFVPPVTSAPLSSPPPAAGGPSPADARQRRRQKQRDSMPPTPPAERSHLLRRASARLRGRS